MPQKMENTRPRILGKQLGLDMLKNCRDKLENFQ